MGISLTNYRCFECNKQLDEEIRDAKKRRELLAMIARKRRGTFISAGHIRRGNKYTFEKKNDSDLSSEEDESQALLGADGRSIKAITLYECGHAFHRACVVRHVEQRLQEERTRKQG